MTNTTCESIMEAVEAARMRIADMLLEIDQITLQENPQIEAEYATKIGYLENDLLKWQLAARRARRKVALAQARVNAGKSFGADEFEEQLDKELEDWSDLLATSMKVFLDTMEQQANSRPMTPSEARELKQLHRKLIKRLHPDLHPLQSGEAARFFMVAQKAFENGSLDMLRSIVVATEGMGGEDAPKGLSPDEMNIELELVLAHERVTAQQLEDLKTRNPYALKAKLEDGAWVIEHTEDLKSKIAEQKEAARAYEERFEELKRGCSDGS